jgi:hypothetical protein
VSDTPPAWLVCPDVLLFLLFVGIGIGAFAVLVSAAKVP